MPIHHACISHNMLIGRRTLILLPLIDVGHRMQKEKMVIQEITHNQHQLGKPHKA